MGDTNMDKDGDLIDYSDVDSDGNPIQNLTKAVGSHPSNWIGLSMMNINRYHEAVTHRSTIRMFTNHPVGWLRIFNTSSEQ
jgi:hypothetical protein